MNREEVAQLVVVVQALWPNFQPNRATGPMWLEVLADHDAGMVSAAVKRLALEGREFAPPVGLLARRAVTERRRAEAESGARWGEFDRDVDAALESGQKRLGR